LIALDPRQVRDVVVRGARIAAVLAVLLAVLAVTQRVRLARFRSDVRQGWQTTVSLLRRPRRASPLMLGSVGLTFGGLAATPGGVGVVEVAAVEGLLLLGAAPAESVPGRAPASAGDLLGPRPPGLRDAAAAPDDGARAHRRLGAGRHRGDHEPLTHRLGPRMVEGDASLMRDAGVRAAVGRW
jgi:hypothetical protein